MNSSFKIINLLKYLIDERELKDLESMTVLNY